MHFLVILTPLLEAVALPLEDFWHHASIRLKLQLTKPSVLYAFADRPKLSAQTFRMLKHLKIQVFSDGSHEQSRKYPDECFLECFCNPRISESVTVSQVCLILQAN